MQIQFTENCTLDNVEVISARPLAHEQSTRLSGIYVDKSRQKAVYKILLGSLCFTNDYMDLFPMGNGYNISGIFILAAFTDGGST